MELSIVEITGPINGEGGGINWFGELELQTCRSLTSCHEIIACLPIAL